MRCKVLHVLLIVALINSAFITSAQSSETTVSVLPVTSAQAIEVAVQNSSELRIESMQVAIKDTEYKRAISAFLPTLDFLTDAWHTRYYDKFTGTTVSVELGNEILTADVEQSTVTYQMESILELKYNLFSGGRDLAFLEEARANQAVAKYQKNSILRKVILDVTTAYWELRKAQLAFGIVERWKNYYSISQKSAEMQLVAGRISQLEKKLADLRLSEQEFGLLQAKRELARVMKKYMCALGLKNNGNIDDVQLMPRLSDDPEEELAHFALVRQKAPELLKIEAEIRAADARLVYERAEFLPKLDLFVDYKWIGRDYAKFSAAYDDLHRNQYIVGLLLQINLFDGFKTSYRISQAALEARLARARLEQKEKEISLRMSEISLNAEKAKDDLALAQQRFKVSETKENIARIQLITGRCSEQDYQKEKVVLQEDEDKVLLARINQLLAKLQLLSVTTAFNNQ